MRIPIRLVEGPLDQCDVEVESTSLRDRPASLGQVIAPDGNTGVYRRWLADDGCQMHTTDGRWCYRWEPEEET